MAEVILDYKASEPSSFTNGGAPVPLPLAGVQLADLGIFIAPPIPVSNRVELKGTVGIQALSGNPVVTFRIFRLTDGIGPGVEIFNKRLTAEPAPAESFYTVSFHMIESDVAAASGFIVYQLFGEVTNAPAGTASAIGPITFTGLAIGGLD